MNAAHADVRGMPAVRLRACDGGMATIMLHGAHVVSWVPAGAPEQLYLSEQAVYAPDQAIRGGVPVIFPQFDRVGPEPGGPRHGIARTRAWRLLQSGQDDDAVFAKFELAHDDATLVAWPRAFVLELKVTLGPRHLEMALTAGNPGSDPYAFTAALHTYLKVADIGDALVEGLAGHRFRDSALAARLGPQAAADADAAIGVEHRRFVDFDGEVDRIYFEAGERLRLRERGPDKDGLAADGACVDLTMRGFEDAVVWNPGPHKAAQLNDLPRNGYRQMVCIEAARIGRPITLEPGQSWTGSQTLHSAHVDE
ncbi:MAG: D-hexose-6-phosphate mutarotase [Burkholderiaceae bacterium]